MQNMLLKENALYKKIIAVTLIHLALGIQAAQPEVSQTPTTQNTSHPLSQKKADEKEKNKRIATGISLTGLAASLVTGKKWYGKKPHPLAKHSEFSAFSSEFTGIAHQVTRGHTVSLYNICESKDPYNIHRDKIKSISEELQEKLTSFISDKSDNAIKIGMERVVQEISKKYAGVDTLAVLVQEKDGVGRIIVANSGETSACFLLNATDEAVEIPRKKTDLLSSDIVTYPLNTKSVLTIGSSALWEKEHYGLTKHRLRPLFTLNSKVTIEDAAESIAQSINPKTLANELGQVIIQNDIIGIVAPLPLNEYQSWRNTLTRLEPRRVANAITAGLVVLVSSLGVASQFVRPKHTPPLYFS